MSKTQGAFIYPPSNANLSFNYLDMVNVTWNTYGKYTANASLQLWIAEGDKQVYVPVYQTSVSAHGSASVPLAYTDFATTGHFQISFSSNRTGYGSNSFSINYDPSQRPTTWNMLSQTPPISTLLPPSTAGSTPSAALAVLPSAAPSLPQMPDFSANAASNRPSTGAIVGIVIACLFFLAVVLLVTWAIRRGHRRQSSRTHSSSTTYPTSASERSRRWRLDPEKPDMVHELWAGEIATELEAEGIGNHDRRNAFLGHSRLDL